MSTCALPSAEWPEEEARGSLFLESESQLWIWILFAWADSESVATSADSGTCLVTDWLHNDTWLRYFWYWWIRQLQWQLLEWQSVTVTLLLIPEGVTVTTNHCIRQILKQGVSGSRNCWWNWNHIFEESAHLYKRLAHQCHKAGLAFAALSCLSHHTWAVLGDWQVRARPPGPATTSDNSIKMVNAKSYS